MGRLQFVSLTYVRHLCVRRALAFLGRDISSADAAELASVQVDAREAARRWWAWVESRNALRRRIRRLLLDLERSQLRAVILVGHSFLFRELFRMAIVEGAAPPEVVEQLTQRKAGHCDVVRCEMNLGLGSITSVHIYSPAAGVVVDEGARQRRRGGGRRVAPESG